MRFETTRLRLAEHSDQDMGEPGSNGGGGGADLLNGYPTGLRDQEECEEDSDELPGSKKDVDAPLERAQHVQEGCTNSNVFKSATQRTKELHVSLVDCCIRQQVMALQLINDQCKLKAANLCQQTWN